MNLSQTPASDWNVAQRIAFRFFFCYFLLFITFDELPQAVGEKLWMLVNTVYAKFLTPLVIWVGTHVLHLKSVLDPNPYFKDGDGDTAFEYVLLFTFVLLAAIATVAWTLADRNRKQYRELNDWLRIYMRYVVAFVILSYGMFKVIKTQFPFPNLGILLSTYGNSNAQNLFWNFMGYSTSYTFFAGAMEVLGGILLFFRRTTTLGALITAGVMLQVVVLDYSYNVNVKIGATHLLLMAVILIVPDLRRLVDVLVLNRATAPANLGRMPTSPRMRAAAIGLKLLLLVLAVSIGTKDSWSGYKMREEARRTPIYGIYDVEEFSLNGQVMPPLTTDPDRWRRVIFGSNTNISFMQMNDAIRTFSAKYEFDKHTVTISAGTPRKQYTLNYSQPDPDHMIVEGPFREKNFSVKLKKFDETKLLLLKDTFHWVY